MRSIALHKLKQASVQWNVEVTRTAKAKSAKLCKGIESANSSSDGVLTGWQQEQGRPRKLFLFILRAESVQQIALDGTGLVTEGANLNYFQDCLRQSN